MRRRLRGSDLLSSLQDRRKEGQEEDLLNIGTGIENTDAEEEGNY